MHVHHADWLAPAPQPAPCWLRPEVVHSIAEAQASLRPLGLALRVHSCWEEDRAGHADGWGVDVALWVLDAEQATPVLHSPLADDEAVDMGTEHGQRDPLEDDAFDSVSPDALQHRDWLRAWLAAHGLHGGEAWWHFQGQAHGPAATAAGAP